MSLRKQHTACKQHILVDYWVYRLYPLISRLDRAYLSRSHFAAAAFTSTRTAKKASLQDMKIDKENVNFRKFFLVIREAKEKKYFSLKYDWGEKVSRGVIKRTH